jgi:hypothetical protein
MSPGVSWWARASGVLVGPGQMALMRMACFEKGKARLAT